MTFRNVPAAPMAGLERQDAPDAMLVFLTIVHPNVSDAIRVVSDVMDYVVAGKTFIGMPFDYQMLSDDESAPQAQIRMQNVDRRIGIALLAENSRAQLTLTIRSSADFNLTVDPRTEVVANTPVYEFRQFDLVDLTVNAVEITGRVMLRDYSQEPWPGLRATQSRVPGLFR